MAHCKAVCNMKPTYRKLWAANESSDVVRFDRGPLLQHQMRITKFKSAFNSHIIGPRARGMQCETNLNVKSWAANLLMLDLTLEPLLKGQTRIAKLKSAYNSLSIGPRGLQCETKL